ncbi:hypothetical protein glysoja_026715 [Glycine soja]|uniref:Uncharacterized protein n=1 Tax=Glycine soja TaxID=3848 RepID=A0A0B2PPF0_GLYSO|nr:hypothetical protein glysoja_026715 [Glycine soja]
MVQPKAAMPTLPCSNYITCHVSIVSTLSFSTEFTTQQVLGRERKEALLGLKLKCFTTR